MQIRSTTQQEINAYITRLQATGVKIDKETTESMQKISEHNLARLQKITRDLQDEGHLTIESLKLALARVTFKIPEVPESTISKGKKRCPEHREHKINPGPTFFIKAGASKNRDDYGGQSSINKGYA